MTDQNFPTIVSGSANFSSEDLVGLSVASARNRFKAALNIPTTARASIRGEAVDGEFILGSGDVLQFDEPTGTKGTSL